MGVKMRIVFAGGILLTLFVVGSRVVGALPEASTPMSSGNLPADPAAVARRDGDRENGRGQSPLTVWYLGHCGFAVRTGSKLLVFDYQTEYGTPSANQAASGLDDGTIDDEDLAGLDTYVFTSHSHSDHYDPATLEWTRNNENVTYLYGWDADHGPDHHYLAGPRATAEVDGLEIYTINSHHSGVPEVAYLVHVDGRWIYHNGDYRQDYVPDFEYLGTLTDHIDVAFHTGLHQLEWQGGQQVRYLLDNFQVSVFFPMHNAEAEEAEAREFASVWAERGYDTMIPVPRARGDRWEF